MVSQFGDLIEPNMHPTPILATFSNISGRPKEIAVVGFPSSDGALQTGPVVPPLAGMVSGIVQCSVLRKTRMSTKLFMIRCVKVEGNQQPQPTVQWDSAQNGELAHGHR